MTEQYFPPGGHDFLEHLMDQMDINTATNTLTITNLVLTGTFAMGGGREVNNYPPPAAAVTIFVRSTGNDTSGDGAAATPYLTITRAMQDVPLVQNGYDYVIDCQEDASFDVPNVLWSPGSGNLTLRGNTTWTAVAYTPNAVQRDALATANHGRRLGLATAPFVAGGERGARFEMTGGALTGEIGWVIDNGTNWVQFEFSNGTFGGLVGAADTFEISDPGTTFQFAAVATKQLLGQVRFESAIVDLGNNHLTVAEGGRATFDTCRVVTGGTTAQLRAQSSHISLVDSYLSGSGSAALWSDRGTFLLDGDGGATVIDTVTKTTAPNFLAGGTVIMGDAVVLARATGWQVNSDVVFAAELDALPATGQWFRFYDCNQGLISVNASTDMHGGGLLRMPYTVGDMTAGFIIQVHADVRDFKARFPYGISVQTAAVANQCSIDGGGTTSFFSDERAVEIYGTGLGERVLLEIPDWHDYGILPAGAMVVGRMPAMTFATAVDTETVSAAFRIPEKYISGSALEFEFYYSDNDAVNTHNNVIDLGTGLYRAGTELANADPPANVHTDLANNMLVSDPVNELTASTRLEVTDAAGQINAVTPTIGDAISLYLRREGTAVADDSTSTLNIYPGTARIYQTGL